MKVAALTAVFFAAEADVVDQCLDMKKDYRWNVYGGPYYSRDLKYATLEGCCGLCCQVRDDTDIWYLEEQDVTATSLGLYCYCYEHGSEPAVVQIEAMRRRRDGSVSGRCPAKPTPPVPTPPPGLPCPGLPCCTSPGASFYKTCSAHTTQADCNAEFACKWEPVKTESPYTQMNTGANISLLTSGELTIAASTDRVTFWTDGGSYGQDTFRELFPKSAGGLTDIALLGPYTGHGALYYPPIAMAVGGEVELYSAGDGSNIAMPPFATVPGPMCGAESLAVFADGSKIAVGSSVCDPKAPKHHVDVLNAQSGEKLGTLESGSGQVRKPVALRDGRVSVGRNIYDGFDISVSLDSDANWNFLQLSDNTVLAGGVGSCVHVYPASAVAPGGSGQASGNFCVDQEELGVDNLFEMPNGAIGAVTRMGRVYLFRKEAIGSGVGAYAVLTASSRVHTLAWHENDSNRALIAGCDDGHIDFFLMNGNYMDPPIPTPIPTAIPTPIPTPSISFSVV